MIKRVVISVLGPDRPGIIATIARFLSENAYNVENVSQTILQGEFSGIFVVPVPESIQLEALRNSLNKDLKLMGLHLHIYEKTNEQNKECGSITKSTPLVITTTGLDSKGLMTHITILLAKRMVNVTDLRGSYKKTSNPYMGEMIYHVEVPSYTDLQDLYKDLRKEAKKLNLKISIEDNGTQKI